MRARAVRTGAGSMVVKLDFFLKAEFSIFVGKISFTLATFAYVAYEWNGIHVLMAISRLGFNWIA